MRLIDADRLIDEFENTIGSPIARTRLKLQVQNQPTIDAVEVVRCNAVKEEGGKLMDDLISRQDAINELSYCQTYLFDSRDHDKKISLEDAEYAIERLPSAQQWIPCSERLPEEDGKYLVVGRQKAINILKFDGGRWYGKWGVVAWMPLPEPYQPKENEQ